jgi:hypothetical protein
MSEFGVRGQDSPAEFFFRVTDRLQMESCLTAIAQDCKSVVISSESNELIDHYGAAFVRRVKQKLPQTQLEVFLPRDTEAMLERFNQLLNTLSLDVATKSRQGLGPEKVWVVHDANAMGGHELQLLTRLIQQFPGAGISVILMFTQGTDKGNDIANQNKQFIPWSLELPTADQKLAAIQQARKSGQEDAAVEFFNRLTKSSVNKKAPPPTAPSSPGSSKTESKKPDAGQSNNVAQKLVRNLARNLALMVIASGLLAISVGVAFWMNPEVGDEFLAKVGSWVRVAAQPKKETPVPPENKAEPSPSEKANAGNASKEAPPGAPNLKELEPKVELVAEPPPPQPAVASNAQPPAAKAPEVKAAEVKAPEVKAPAAKVITELPEAAVQGRLWLKGLPSDAFVLEHQTFSSLKEARAFIKDKEWLVNARITPVFLEGKDEVKFAVMTGHYRSIDRAKNTITRLKLPTNVTITSVQMAINQAEPNKAKP